MIHNGIATIDTQAADQLLLRWILRLRWIAVTGQFSAMLVAHFVFQLCIHWVAMIACLVATALTNHLVLDFSMGSRKQSAFLIFGDSLLLTVMLYFSGGVHNPFCAFYLLFIALAAMVLNGRALSFLLAFVACEVACISIAFVPFNGPSWAALDGKLKNSVFLTGWGVSLVVIAVCIAFFVHRINRQLRQREMALAEAERNATEANRFQSLATLAAGVAHELGTPLGTIAVASKDLERSLLRDGAGEELLDDAVLIRSEVERCRQILNRLDSQSTRRIGEAPESCTAAMICQKLRDHIKAEDFSRLEIDDRTEGFPLVLSVQAVLQSLVVLIENACEADTAGNPVRLDIRIHDRKEVYFRIYDNGPGIPEMLRARIGQPFFTTKPHRSSMGLGIFLVQTLTTHLDGSCTLSGVANGGTCATLRLPAKQTST
jgi:two-component system sensor histidine kinase RegB